MKPSSGQSFGGRQWMTVRMLGTPKTWMTWPCASGFGGRVALTDNMIHQQDIRRPLGLPRTIDSERLRAALDFVRYAPTIRGAWRVRGVKLVATDVDWSHGKGPEVRGPGEALLMVMAGRTDALGDLGGSGVAILSSHV